TLECTLGRWAGRARDVAAPFGPGSAPEVQRACIPRERRASLAGGRVDGGPEIGRRRPRIVGAFARRDPDVLPLRAGPVRREHDLASVLAHVRLDVVRG